MAPRRSGGKYSSEGKGKQRAQDDAMPSSGSDRSRSAPKSDHGPSTTHWTVEDEETLLDLALMNQAMMGNGGNFRNTFWNDVAAKFPVPAHGKAKTAESCKDKWKRMKTTYDIVHKIATTSGLAYSLERGADIGLESKHVWDEIVKNTKGVSKFKKKGWSHYDKMKQLLPSKSKGTYRFTAQDAPAPLPATSQSSILPLPPGATSQSRDGNATVAGPDITMDSSHWQLVPNRLEPTQFNTTGPSFPSPSSSAFRPPSVPASCIGSASAVSSIQPSSSVSVRFNDSNKRKADDDISMVSATAGSVASVTRSVAGSGVSTGSRKRRTTARSTENSELSATINNSLTTLQSNMHSNQAMMEQITAARSASGSSRAATNPGPSQQVVTVTSTTGNHEERKILATQLLIEHDQDYLSTEQILLIFDIFGEKSDNVNEYIVLATLPVSTPELRHGWLRKKLASVQKSGD